ncbi:Protein FAM13C [Acipenser ruthenus]|uniref:Protein FAM13C n=1 Tax=Acipenser ruthenus TaxID=7906 RepID=A0A444UMD8_ACIRT|nr:Protein FAM13C [Acipenser ruthenus]
MKVYFLMEWQEKHPTFTVSASAVDGKQSVSSVKIKKYNKKISPESLPQKNTKIFNVSLETLRENGQTVCGVPWIVHSIVEYLDKYGNKDEAELNQHVKKLLGDLPQEHYSVLRYLCNFLQRVASHSQSNQMTMENLAIVFGPCFFQSSPVEVEVVREESVTSSKQHFIRHILENHAIHRGLSLTALSARDRRRLLRQQEDACRLKEMDDKNKENLPCHAVEVQLRFKETTPHAEKKALEDLEKIIEDSFKSKRSKSSSETNTEHDQDYSQDMANKMQSLSAYQMNAGLSESRRIQNASFQAKEILDFQNSTAHSLTEDTVELQDFNELVEDDPTGSTQLQPSADNTTPAATEESNASSKGTIQDDSSLLKLQDLEVDLCSSFLPAQEDSAQVQNPKEHRLQAGLAAQGEDANTGEPQPAFRNCQNEADIQAEAQQYPGTSRLLHHITDGDNPQPSPRCPSFSQSQRFNTDPESAPSPPCSQQFRMSRGIVRGDSPETAKEPVSVTLLKKHIQNAKKKIGKYEETFEQERKYRPSHNDKTANPEIFKLMNDLAKSRKQLKDLKLKKSVKELCELGSQQRELSSVNSGQQGAVELQQKPCLEETVESLIMRLKEKRTALGLPENMKEEEGSDEENMQHNPLPPSRIISQNSSDESLCPYEEDNEPAFVSPLDEMKAVRQNAVTMSNLHEASMPELLEHLRETRAEKKRLRKALRDFEDQFLRQVGRAAQKEDRIPIAEEYSEFKQIKAKLRLLEVLVSKRGAAQTT